MADKKNNIKLKIFLIVMLVVIGAVIVFYVYLFSQFKVNDIVYDKDKGLGKITGISLPGDYLVQWQDGSFSKEPLSSLKGKKQLGLNKLEAVDRRIKPDYFFYASDNGKRAVIINNYSGNLVSGSEIVPSYEEKGMFVWRVGAKDCKPDYSCEDWEECRTNYNVDSLLSGQLVIGVRTRNCRDYSSCFSDFVEYENCNVKESITTKNVKIGDKNYLEVYDSKESLVARLDLVNVTDGRIDNKLNIQMIFDDSKYYPYCYDGVKDYNEDEVDCVYQQNGYCPVCK